MTAQTRTTLKAKFEQGDTPQGSDFADLIDSFISVADATAQSMTSDLSVPKLDAATVSATNVIASTVAATQVSATNIIVSTVVATRIDAGSVSAATISANALTVSGDATIHGNLTVDGTLDFGALPHGEIYITAAVPVSASASFVDLIATATAFTSLLESFAVTAGSLQYTGVSPRTFMAVAAISIHASAVNTQTVIALSVDSSALERTQEQQEIGTTDVEFSLHGLVQLAPNERIGLVLKGDDAAGRGWEVDNVVLTVHEV